VELCLARNAAARDRLTSDLRALELGCDTSFANFVLARFGTSAEADAAEAHLRGDAILVRKVAGYGLPHALRITVGSDADCDRLVQSLRAWRESAR